MELMALVRLLPFIGILMFSQIPVAFGSKFAIAFLGHEENVTASEISYELILINPGTTTISVTFSGMHAALGLPNELNQPVNVVGNSQQTVTVPTEYMLNGTEYANKSIIVSSADKFFVRGLVKRVDNNNYLEGFNAISMEDLAGPNTTATPVYEYVAATFCALQGFCQIAITAFSNDTKVSITFPAHVEKMVMCIKKTYFRTERDTTLTMGENDVVQFETTSDLSGTHIYSFQPIAVFVGSHHLVQGSVVAHTIEQLAPASLWGQQYALKAISSNGYGDIIKIATHYAQTTIEMQGFHSFVIASDTRTATRRLEKGMVSFIKASAPIQVVQIPGIVYASNASGEVCTVAMTVVPAIEHMDTDNPGVHCGGLTPALHVVSAKSDGVSPATSVPYTDYSVSSAIAWTGTSQKAGILKCGNALMPLSLSYVNSAAQANTSSNGSIENRMCIEGITASVAFMDGVSTLQGAHTQNILDYDVVKLRARVCGPLVVQFDSGFNSSTVMLKLTDTKIAVSNCFPTCSQTTEHDSTYNAVPGRNCSVDMVTYWFRKVNQPSGSMMLCAGSGHFVDTSASCTVSSELTTVMPANTVITQMKLLGLFSDAVFHYDLEQAEGCTHIVSDWRCQDVLTNCSAYASEMCSNSQYDGFAKAYCEKFCSKCGASSTGRNFRVALPNTVANPADDNLSGCTIHVTGSGPINVAAGTASKMILGDTSADRHTAYYNCFENHVALSMVFLLSDVDVSVTVVFKHNTDYTFTSRVYPVDTFGTQVMPFNFCESNKCQCTIVTERQDAQVTGYFTVTAGVSTNDATSQVVKPNDTLYIETNSDEGLTNGGLFVSDTPIGVFCGPLVLKDKRNHFNQILPTSSWGTEYQVPSYGAVSATNPFSTVKLVMKALHDLTIVNITGDLDAVHPLLNRGSIIDQSVSSNSAYKIVASSPIMVGVLYETDLKQSNFITFPPTTGFLTTNESPLKSATLGNMIKESEKTYYVNTAGVTTETTLPSGARCGVTVVKTANSRWFVMAENFKVASLPEQTPCVTSPATTPADSKDNDCDKLVDEDVCYRGYGVYPQDSDLDGEFGDDCSKVETTPVIFTAPAEPSCLDITTKPDGQCWTVCTCKCSWVKNLEATAAMSDEEKQEKAESDIAKYKEELKIETNELSSTTAQKVSKDDERTSAKGIGYLGISMFSIVFGSILILDFASLVRDARTFMANLKEGFGRARDFLRRKQK